MLYRILGKTGLKVSALGFGGSSLGGAFGGIDEQKGIRSVQVALDRGINLIDTAPYYGSTRAETVLGQALKGVNRDSYILATKVSRLGVDDFDFSAGRVARSIDESLARLGVDWVDFLQVHDIEFGEIRQIVEETIPALHRIKAAGKARFVGITGLHPHLFRQVMDRVEVDQIQSYCHFTLNDTALADLLPYLKEKQAVIFNSAPLAMRLLSDHGPPDWHPAPAALRERCAAAARYCRERGASLGRLALQYSVSQPDIHTTIVGTADPLRVEQNVRDAFEAPDPNILEGVLAILKPVHNLTWRSGRPENNP